MIQYKQNCIKRWSPALIYSTRDPSVTRVGKEMSLLPFYWQNSFLPQQQNQCCQHRILFLPSKAEAFHRKPVCFFLYKHLQTSMPDAGIRGLRFYCMTLDMHYTCSQWRRETKGWKDSQVPSKGNSAICRELRGNSLPCSGTVERASNKRTVSLSTGWLSFPLWFSLSLADKGLYMLFYFNRCLQLPGSNLFVWGVFILCSPHAYIFMNID